MAIRTNSQILAISFFAELLLTSAHTKKTLQKNIFSTQYIIGFSLLSLLVIRCLYYCITKSYRKKMTFIPLGPDNTLAAKKRVSKLLNQDNLFWASQQRDQYGNTTKPPLCHVIDLPGHFAIAPIDKEAMLPTCDLIETIQSIYHNKSSPLHQHINTWVANTPGAIDLLELTPDYMTFNLPFAPVHTTEKANNDTQTFIRELSSVELTGTEILTDQHRYITSYHTPKPHAQRAIRDVFDTLHTARTTCITNLSDVIHHHLQQDSPSPTISNTIKALSTLSTPHKMTDSQRQAWTNLILHIYFSDQSDAYCQTTG